MTEIFQQEQPNTLFGTQNPSTILAALRSKNRPQQNGALPIRDENTLEANSSNSTAKSSQADDTLTIFKVINQEATPQSVFGDYFDEEDICSSPRKTKKKAILRRVSRKAPKSEEIEKLPLESHSNTSTDKDTSVSDTTPKSKKVKRVTFADQLETYESPRFSKIVFSLPKAKESPQHKEDDMQIFQKCFLSKFALEALPKIGTPETSQNVQPSPPKSSRRRHHVRSDQALGTVAGLGQRGSNDLTSCNSEPSPVKLPMIMSPSVAKINQDMPSSLSLRGGSIPSIDFSKMSRFSLLGSANSGQLSERNYNSNNCLLPNNTGFLTGRGNQYQQPLDIRTSLEDSSLLRLKSRGSIKMLIRKTNI